MIFTVILTVNQLTYAQDPGTMGSETPASSTYDLGNQNWTPPSLGVPVDVKGVVHYPSGLSGGNYPVLLFLHGKHRTCYSNAGGLTNNWPCMASETEIPSYLGYDYLGEFMASHGYIVISISGNGINGNDDNSQDFGMQARAEIMQHHLDLWNTWNTSASGPFGGQFVGKLDMQNIGTMGHSRGGEGAALHYSLNQQQGAPYGIKAILQVAPTNAFRATLQNVDLGVILGYCDGDLPTLQGVQYYDDARYANVDNEGALHTVLMMGANHNYYNYNWTPGGWDGGSDDWEIIDANQTDSHCGTSSSSNQRLTPAEQRAATITYAAAFYRRYLGSETQFAPILEVDEIQPPSSSGLTSSDVLVSYHPPTEQRLEINTTESEDHLTTNSHGESVSGNGLTTENICGATQAEHYCLNVEGGQEPHNDNVLGNALGLSQLEIAWDGNSDNYENTIALPFRDLSQFSALQFRVGWNFVSGSYLAGQDFSIELEDGSGAMHAEKISDYSGALYNPPGDLAQYMPKLVHNTVKIPVSAYSGLDLTDIEVVRFKFDQTATGAILMSDLILVSVVLAFNLSNEPETIMSPTVVSVSSPAVSMTKRVFSSVSVRIICSKLLPPTTCPKPLP